RPDCRHAALSHPRIVLSLLFPPTPSTAISTLSLHDALPIYPSESSSRRGRVCRCRHSPDHERYPAPDCWRVAPWAIPFPLRSSRSEEHTSELQSRFDLVCRLLLEKKKFLDVDLEDWLAKRAD